MTIKELITATEELQKRITQISAVFDDEKKKARIAALEREVNRDDFWNDAQKAGKIMQKLETLKKERARMQSIVTRCVDLATLLTNGSDDESALYEEEYENLAKAVDALEVSVLLSEPYDEHDAIITLYAGAGGTDAQDWVAMLLRMYMRWAERHGFKSTILDESRGAEAGYKSVTCEISGERVYGFLRMEMGTHRLVRLSPFNADNLRQTSFARVEVLPVLEDAQECALNPQDLRIDTYRSQGAGGQSVNTTDSAVRITHIPTGIVVTCQNERSQLQNKEHALRVLRGKLLQRRLEEQAKERAALRSENVSAEWGSQIRSYVLHPYKMVKDHRTLYETSHVDDVLDGDIDVFIGAALRWHFQREHGILDMLNTTVKK